MRIRRAGGSQTRPYVGRAAMADAIRRAALRRFTGWNGLSRRRTKMHRIHTTLDPRIFLVYCITAELFVLLILQPHAALGFVIRGTGFGKAFGDGGWLDGHS